MLIRLHKNFSLRPWRLTDCEDLAFHANDRKIADDCNYGFPHPYTIDVAEGFLAKNIMDHPYTSFCIAENDQCIGMINCISKMHPLNPTAEIGYWVGRAKQGQGVAKHAARAFTDYLFNQFEFIERIEAFVAEANIGSQKALEFAGFVREAELKKRYRLHNQLMSDYFYAKFRS